MIHNVVIGQMIVIVLSEICLLFSVVSYIKIYIEIRDLDIYRSLSTARYSADNNQVSIGIERNQHCRRVAEFQESGLTNVPIILWIIVVITVMPYMLVMQGFLMREILCSYCGFTKFATYVIEGLYPIKILNFELTPFVYAWQLPKFRKMFKKTFCDFFICRLVSRNIYPPTTIALSSSTTTDDSDALTPCSGSPGIITTPEIITTPLEEDYTDSLTCVCTKRSSSSTATYTDSSTASFGTCSSNTMAGTGSPTEMVGTGGPTEMAGTCGPTEMAGTGSPTEMAGTGSPTEMAGTGSPTEMDGSGGSSAIPATVCSFAIYHDHLAIDDNVNSTLA
ncbi:uncharacterized protein LOC124441414 [Xenia sp. Carnegie-2017]|uniref:uncharacterized protein LOC124441414 n=1 Tax=Xenia sp. Carnegie-2017 TaxID=2897299 RepID=UPI001F033BED|nr:uncharacterized protein LOC124441414 [Xenia sp. Carnegie-2017]